MAKSPRRNKTAKKWRADQLKLSAEEVKKRMESLPERMEAMIAAIRKGKDRSVPA